MLGEREKEKKTLKGLNFSLRKFMGFEVSFPFNPPSYIEEEMQQLYTKIIDREGRGRRELWGFFFSFLIFSVTKAQLFQEGFNCLEFGVSPTHPHACFP